MYYCANGMDTLKIFCSYAPQDKSLMESLHKHLRRALELRHISIWYTHSILPGREWERERDSQVHSADIILFLVSADFIDSRDLYDKEVLPAMERHNKGETLVIPVILRPVDWRETPFGKLRPLPDGGKSVVDWITPDHAFLSVVNDVKRAIDKIRPPNPKEEPPEPPEPAPISQDAGARLEQLIQNFKALRGQITDYVRLKGPKGFTIEGCENQYDGLYAETMVFLTTYLPECVSDGSEGFVAIIQGKAALELHQRSNPSVSLARRVFSPLAKSEKLAAQINACVSTLELYRQRHFPASERSS